QAHLIDFGAVGSGPAPLEEAYRQLAPSLRQRMTRDQFFAHFQGLAHLKLLQAHAAYVADKPARIFVEEERTMVINGIPAVAWYAGVVAMTLTPDGWKVSSLQDVRPEDIISLELGGHQPWRADPEYVALVQFHCFEPVANCKVISNSLSSGNAPR